jgi:hypothetical protein
MLKIGVLFMLASFPLLLVLGVLRGFAVILFLAGLIIYSDGLVQNRKLEKAKKKPRQPQNPQNDDLGKQSPGIARRAKCLVAFRTNIVNSINKQIGTTVQKRPDIPFGGRPLQTPFNFTPGTENL